MLDVGCAVRTRNTVNSIPAQWDKPHVRARRTLHTPCRNLFFSMPQLLCGELLQK